MYRNRILFIFALFILQHLYPTNTLAASLSESAVAFSNQGISYEVLSDVELITNPDINTQPSDILLLESKPPNQLSKQEITTNREVVGNIGSMLLVKKPVATRLSGTRSTAGQSNDVLYVRNLANKSVGIVKGELFVDLVDTIHAGQIAAEYELVYRLLLPGSSTTLMEASVSDNFFNRIERLRADKRITAVEVRVITELPELN